mgnify:CR=1 FL=1
MIYEDKTWAPAQKREVHQLDRPNKTYTPAYVVILEDIEGNIQDTPYATFERAAAEEIALEYAYELMWEDWYYKTHKVDSGSCDWIKNAFLNSSSKQLKKKKTIIRNLKNCI